MTRLDKLLENHIGGGFLSVSDIAAVCDRYCDLRASFFRFKDPDGNLLMVADVPLAQEG